MMVEGRHSKSRKGTATSVIRKASCNDRIVCIYFYRVIDEAVVVFRPTDYHGIVSGFFDIGKKFGVIYPRE